MREEIRALQQRLKLTVAYVTHDQAEALAVSDQIIVMDQGQIAQAGSPRELYERPRTSFVAGFMGEALLFDAVALGDGRVNLGPLGIQPRERVRPGSVKVAVRPEAWVVSAPGAQAGAGQLAGRLTKLAYLGSGLELSFETALGAVFLISGDAIAAWKVGDVAALSLGQHGVSVVTA